MKSTSTYWNPLDPSNSDNWKEVDGSNGNILELTISEDPITGDYTRLTKFKAGYSTDSFGAKSHDYPEEIFIVSGRVYDKAFEQWLETGTYASRAQGEVHGPFVADGDVLIMEVSYPSLSIKNN
jgi:hypothetical protein